MGWTIEIVSVKSYLATKIVVLPLYFSIENVKNEMFLSKKKYCKGSAEPSVSPTFAVNRRLNKNEEKNQ